MQTLQQFALLSILACVAACGPSEEARLAASENAAEDARADALAEVPAEVASGSYSEVGAPYGCTEDCEGHEAGFQWAAENDITDPGDCAAEGDSFNEGCMAFAEEVQEQVEARATAASEEAYDEPSSYTE